MCDHAAETAYRDDIAYENARREIRRRESEERRELSGEEKDRIERNEKRKIDW